MGWAATAAPPRGTRREQRRRGSPPDRTVRRSWLELLEEGGQRLDGVPPRRLGEGRLQHELPHETKALAVPPEGGDAALRADRRRGREGEDGVGARHPQALPPERLCP